MRPIDADALMARIDDCVFTADMTTTLAVNMACRWIDNAPTIELERKTGRWTKAYDGNDDHVKCTGCFKTYDWISQAQYYNYCPNCGAYMGGEQDGSD